MPDHPVPGRLAVLAVLAALLGVVGWSALHRGGAGSTPVAIAVEDPAPAARRGTPAPGGAAQAGAPASTAATAQPAPGAAPDGAAPAATADAQVIVHVAGAVRHPGLYRLPAGARIDDAIRRAGGAARRADTDGVNLAAPAQDGGQILVPRRGRAVPAAAAAGGAAAAAGSQPDAPISLNTATLEQLDTLDGVGPTTAQKILDYREAHGGFRSIDELDQIPGIGEKRMASLRSQVTL